LKWFSNKASGRWNTTTCFGVVGTHAGVGVTQISISLSYFLSEIYAKRVAVIEMNSSGDFARLEKEWKQEWKVKSRENCFSVGRNTFYKHVGTDEIPFMPLNEYDYCIFDMGAYEMMAQNEFLRCDHKIVVCSLTEWKRLELEVFLEDMKDIQGYKEWNYLSNLCSKKVNDSFYAKNIILKTVPFMEEPFGVSKELIKLYKTII